MEFKREGRLWLPDRPRFITGRKQSLLAVTNLAGFGGGGGGPISITLDNTLTSAGSASSLVYTLTNAIPAGSLILVLVMDDTGFAASAMTDSVSQTNWVNDQSKSNAPRLQVYSCWNCIGMSAGATITANWAGGVANRTMIVAYASNMLTSGTAFDKGNAANGTSSSPSSGSSAALVQANELVVGGASWNSAATTITAEGGSFLLLADKAATATRLHAAYEIVAATTAQTYAPTLSGSQNWDAVIVTYKGASP